MQSVGELSHTQSDSFQDSLEACQCDYSRSAGSPTRLRQDSYHRPYHSPSQSVTLGYPTGMEQRRGAIRG